MSPRCPRSMLALLAVLAVLTGCRSLSSYHFGPSPQAHELADEGEATPIARVQVSALGLAEAEEGVVMRFRLRIENPETAGLLLNRASFELVDGSLTPFEPPSFHVVPDDHIAVGQTKVVDVAFGLPHRAKPKDIDLSGLVLTWGVKTEEQEYTTTARFEELNYYYPCGCGALHWGPYGYYHAGYGYTYGYRY